MRDVPVYCIFLKRNSFTTKNENTVHQTILYMRNILRFPYGDYRVLGNDNSSKNVFVFAAESVDVFAKALVALICNIINSVKLVIEQ